AHASAPDAPQAARDHFLAAGLHEGARTVSAYRRIRSELDPEPLMLALIERGCRLCVPVIEGTGLSLKFREWTPGVRMQSGPFGAQVPAEGAWLEPDLLIVPLLAFDACGRRLGYGGGFYDRTIPRLADAGPVRAVGFAYAAQQVDEVPVEETDRVLDAVITEAGLVRPRTVAS
ncbi:MAG TPA: 5-formyltetrahydrofolate cyclo-ligase, partial [Paracoccaceae bacterium]|nr:5-formyltetrahydrofolate cyclo-ligase [Paracoccaceae bacterium]